MKMKSILMGALALGCACAFGGESVVAQKLQTCDFLLNKDFKKNAKHYLCLFSASWCGPCRAEMPRITKMYAETLKADPDVELIHFSRDQNDEKALAWAKEHDVKFPVVKPKGGNPLNLQIRGIPHLFIVKQDGTLVEEGHPMRIFTDEKIRDLKEGKLVAGARPKVAKGDDTETVGGYTWTYRVSNGAATIVAAGKARRCTISPRPKGHVVIPMKLGGVNVTRIGVESFCECTEMTSVEIPETVTEICWRAFSECGGLSSVMIPAGVKTIRPSAFSACNQLKAFSVNTENENYASQGGVLFDKGIKKLICYPGGLQGSYEVPSGVTEIEGNAFSGCKGLTSVIVADSVTRMGEFVFSQSRNLTSVTLGSGVRGMGQAPFHWCSGLTSITVNESNEAYASRDGVLFDKGMKLLVCCPGGYAGDYVIPEGVRTIGRYAFDSCHKLTGVTIPSGVEVIDYHAFNYCQGLSVVIPSSVKKIGDWAFCRALKAVTISEGVTSVGAGVFCGCSELASVVIPSSVASIGKYVFSGCKELASLTMRGERPNASDNMFRDCGKLKAIHVPVNAKSWAGMKEWQGIPLVFDEEKVASDAKTEKPVSGKSFAARQFSDEKLRALAGKDSTGQADLQAAKTEERTEAVNGYVWSYRVDDGEATIIAETDRQFACAVTPCPIRGISIPNTLGGAKVTRIGRGAFKDCSGLTSVTIPEGVTHIGRDAFRDCTGLLFAKIPSSVKVIEWDAFGNCNALRLLMLPAGLTDIGRGAFHWCCGLMSVAIPSSVTHIGQDAFLGCRNLTSVTIPPHVTDIGWATFRGCNALTSVTIPAGVTNINFTAFCDTGALTSFRVDEGNQFYKSENGLLLTKDGTTLVRGVNGDVRIPASVTAIGPCAFEGSVALRPVVIPSGVKSIGDHAFKQCRGMTTVTIPSSVTSIGREVFNNCKGLKSMTIPATLTNNIDRTAFDGCSNLKTVNVVKDGKMDEVPFAEFSNKWKGSRPVGLPARSSLRERLMSRQRQGQVSEGKETVGDYTWSYSIRNGGASIEAPGGRYECAVSPCPEGEIVIPAKLGGVAVTRIGRGAFSRCHALTSVTIPPTVTSIGMSAFYECRMSSVTIPPSVKEIGDLAFYHTGLKSVMIPEGVVSIGRKAFEHCWSMESVSIPSSVTNIGRSAFAVSNVRMKSIVVSPKNQRFAVYDGLLCTKDGKTVLAGVGGEVKIPKGVTCIDDEAFYQCDGLTSVTIPPSVAKIGNAAFEWCDNIEMFSVANENQEFAAINGLLCTKDGRTLIAGVNGNVVLPDGMTNIMKLAFSGRRGLRTVTIPSSVKTIDTEAFRCCKGLTSVTMYGERPSARNGVFDYCEKLKVIHVPANAKSWAGMKEWQGIPLVFDVGKTAAGPKVDKPVPGKNVAAQKLQTCDFLLNKDFKKNAKYYLCLFSASWCGPCRREMPRIAKTYAETLKADPNIELIHFSRDQNDEKALAWAQEHDVLFPVVKPKGGNPLNLQCRGIPHLFIVKADGTLVEEGHPAKLFCEEKLNELK